MKGRPPWAGPAHCSDALSCGPSQVSPATLTHGERVHNTVDQPSPSNDFLVKPTIVVDHSAKVREALPGLDAQY